MLKILRKIIAVLLLAIIFILSTLNFIQATYNLLETTIVEIAEIETHLKYYSDEQELNSLNCKIEGYYEDDIFYPAYFLEDNDEEISVDSYAIELGSLVENNEIWRVVTNGYPYKTAEELGVASDYDAYAVTKFAIQCLNGKTDVNLYVADDEEGQAMLNALKKLVDIGKNGADTFSNKIQIEKIGDFTQEDNYYSLYYMLTSNSEFSTYTINSISGLKDGDIVTDTNNNVQTTFNSNENFKIKILKSNFNEDKNIDIEISADLKSYPIYYGKNKISGKQNYILTADYYENITSNINTSVKLNTGSIEINKKDCETREGIESTTFEIYAQENNNMGAYTTNENGKIIISDLYPGNYIVKETVSNEKYIKSDVLEYEVEVKYNETSILNIENKKIKGFVQIINTASLSSDITNIEKGNGLAGTVFELYDESKNIVQTITTNNDGVATTSSLEKGAYTIKEVSINEWYELDNTIYTVEILENNQTITLNVENEPKLPSENIEESGVLTATADEEIEYNIKIENTGNVELYNFIIEDNFPTEYINVTKINLGTYSQEGNYDLYYKTNLSDEYILLLEDLSNLIPEEVDISKELEDGEYVTSIKIDFGTVNKDFKSESGIKILAKVNSNVKHDDVFINDAVLSSEYNGYKLYNSAEVKTVVYKILPLTGV